MDPRFETVGRIRKGNIFYTYQEIPAIDVAIALLHSRYTGMPVVNRKGKVIGIVSEQDLLRALRGTRRLEEIKVEEIMTRPPIVVEEETTLEEANKLMEAACIARLPVVKEGVLVGTVTRNDLLRTWLGEESKKRLFRNRFAHRSYIRSIFQRMKPPHSYNREL